MVLKRAHKYAVIDCVASSPMIKAKAYTSPSIRNSYIHAGFINSFDSCTDVYESMQATDVPFSSDRSLQDLFISKIEYCASVMNKSIDGANFP